MAEGWLAALLAAQAAAKSGNQAGIDAIIAETQVDPGNLGGSSDWWNRLIPSEEAAPQQGATLAEAEAAAARWKAMMDARSRSAVGRTSSLPPSFGGIGNSLGFGAQQGGGSTPLAAGFPILQGMVDMLLRANADRRAGIDQQVNIARLLVDLQRVSPTRAADMAVRLGITNRAGVPMAAGGGGAEAAFTPGPAGFKPIDNVYNLLTSGSSSGGGLVGDMFQQDSFGFANLFGTGAQFALAGGPRIGGMIGNESVSLPSTFSGQELDFFSKNPNVSRVVADVADKFGMPDIFDRSMAARIPTLSSILSGGFG